MCDEVSRHMPGKVEYECKTKILFQYCSAIVCYGGWYNNNTKMNENSKQKTEVVDKMQSDIPQQQDMRLKLNQNLLDTINNNPQAAKKLYETTVK